VRIPERADLVIIGGGTMGASLAYFLTRQNDWAGRSMVVLEARDVASGASGRNGVSPPSFPCPLADVSCTLCRAISDRQPAKRSSHNSPHQKSTSNFSRLITSSMMSRFSISLCTIRTLSAFFRLSCLYFQNDSLPTCIVTCSPRVEEIVRRAQRRHNASWQ
jgi:hypothetical protein